MTTSPADAQHVDLPAFHAELATIEQPSTDRGTVRLVVLVLGLVAVAGIVLIGVLAYQAKAVPDALIALASASLSAVAALLAKTSTTG